MRKRYLFLLTLLLTTMFSPSNLFAEDPPQSEYEAALKEIADGAYYLVTEVGETKWYVTQSGYLTEDKDGAYLFAISKVDASGAADRLFNTAWHFYTPRKQVIVRMAVTTVRTGKDSFST